MILVVLSIASVVVVVVVVFVVDLYEVCLKSFLHPRKCKNCLPSRKVTQKNTELNSQRMF